MRFLLLIAALFSSQMNAFEKQVVLNYDGFFDRMDDLNVPEFVDIKLAFYFVELGSTNACTIIRSQIRTKLDSMDVYFLESGELLLPFDCIFYFTFCRTIENITFEKFIFIIANHMEK